MPRDDAFDDAPRARAVGTVERTEAQRVQQRDRPRAHREDVADDAADAGRRALVGLDERRVVVRLDLEDRGEPVADVDGAGVLARPLQHARAGRSAASSGGCASSCSCSARTTSPRRCRARSAVGSRPQRARRCGRIRRASGRAVRGRSASMAAHDDAHRCAPATPARARPTRTGRGRRRCRAPARRRARDAASARRRCARSLQMPAMLLSEPFGFAASVTSPPRVAVAEDDAAGRPRARAIDVGRRVVVAFAVRDRHAAAPGPGAARCGERRVGLLDADAARARSGTSGRGCAASRPAAGRPRAAPGSRCRCRAPGRRAARTRATAAMIGENRAMAPVRR